MPTSPDIRGTLLFRTLAKGRERKVSRPLTEGELLELEKCVTRAQDKVQVGRRTPYEAARAGVAALPKVLQATAAVPGASHKRIRRGASRHIANVGLLVRNALAEIGHGPKLPPYARKSSALYVQQEDLDELIPDGWGAQFSTEVGRLGKSVGLPPAAIPLLCLLQLTSSFRPPISFSRDRHECGSGFQVSLDWLAQKLGVTRVWVQQLLNTLDPFAPWRRECQLAKRENRRRAKRGQELEPLPEKPTGTAYVHRFRRLKRYEDLCPEAARRRIWVDDKGKPHLYVDVRGVVYLTSAGRSVLGQARPVDAAADVDHRTRSTRWFISARLRRGHTVIGPNAAEVLETRRELAAAPDVPKNLSPNYIPLKNSPKN